MGKTKKTYFRVRKTKKKKITTHFRRQRQEHLQLLLRVQMLDLQQLVDSKHPAKWILTRQKSFQKHHLEIFQRKNWRAASKRMILSKNKWKKKEIWKQIYLKQKKDEKDRK